MCVAGGWGGERRSSRVDFSPGGPTEPSGIAASRVPGSQCGSICAEEAERGRRQHPRREPGDHGLQGERGALSGSSTVAHGERRARGGTVTVAEASEREGCSEARG